MITTFSNVSPLHIKWTSGPKTYLLQITTITKLNTGALFLVHGLELDTMKYLWRNHMCVGHLKCYVTLMYRAYHTSTMDTYWSIHLYEGFHSYLFACLRGPGYLHSITCFVSKWAEIGRWLLSWVKNILLLLVKQPLVVQILQSIDHNLLQILRFAVFLQPAEYASW